MHVNIYSGHIIINHDCKKPFCCLATRRNMSCILLKTILPSSCCFKSRNKKLVYSRLMQAMRPFEMVSIMFMVVMNIMCIMLAASAAHVEHKVGGTVGWNYPPKRGIEFFANWAAQNKFHVGDSLSFAYTTGVHNVVQVDRSDYDACTSYKPLQLYRGNKVVVNLSKPGTYYYICGIKGHCQYGMKVALIVT